DLLVSGQYVSSGGRLRVDVRIAGGDGAILASFAEEAPSSMLLDLVARAGADVRLRLGGSPEEGAPALPRHPAAGRPCSLAVDALRHYTLGAARDGFSGAIAADPSFALAHLGLAETWEQLGYAARARAAADEAYRLSDGLSRADHLLIEGYHHEQRGAP